MVLFKHLVPSRRKIKSLSSDKKHTYSVKDYDATYTIALTVTRLVGGIRLKRNDSPTATRCWNIFFWVFEFFNLGFAATLEFLKMVDTGRGGSFQDAIDIFRMMPCINYVMLGMAKSFNIVYHRPVFENLIAELRDMWPEGEVTEEQHQVIRPALKHLHRVIKVYYWANNILLLIFLSPPFIDMIRRWFGADVSMALPFFFLLPFDPYQPGIFEFMLLLQIWEAMLTIWMQLAGDILFCVFISHISTQFDLLAIRAKDFVHVAIDKQLIASYPLALNTKEFMKNNDETRYSGAEMERAYKREVIEMVKRHQALIRLSGDVENMFSVPLLLNFVNSSVVICFCGFCCVIVEKWNEMTYKSFLTTALTQTWLLCWYGQRMLESSEGVSLAIYKSGWYRVSKAISSSLLIMIHRAQKQVHVTTYGFSVISLASYTTIIKTSWSYFTLLLNIYKKK